jgi:hypothetical protein
MTASLSVMPGEDGATTRRFFAGIYAEFKPRGAAEAVLVDQYASIAWKLRRLGAAEQSVAADRLGKDMAKWLEDWDNIRWCKKHHPDILEEGEDKLDQPPGGMVVSELLSEELDKGKGPLLRLMELEMRLRATLTNTLKQLKDLRALHQARAKEDAEDGAGDEPEATVEWDDDEDRWGDAADGVRARARAPRRSSAKRQAAAAPAASATVPDVRNEATAAPESALSDDAAQPSTPSEVTRPAEAAGVVAEDVAITGCEPAQATQPDEEVLPPMTPISSDENGPESPPSSV